MVLDPCTFDLAKLARNVGRFDIGLCAMTCRWEIRSVLNETTRSDVWTWSYHASNLHKTSARLLEYCTEDIMKHSTICCTQLFKPQLVLSTDGCILTSSQVNNKTL